MDDPFGSPGAEPPPPYLGGAQPPGISERMQALMSRAEQEVAEQRQLQALVGDVRQALGQISDEIRQVAGAHTLELVRGEVTTLAAEVRSTTTMLGERLDAVVRAVGASAQVMQGVGQQLDRVTELLNHQQQQLAGLTAAAAQQRDVLGTLPDAVAARAAGSTNALGERVSAQLAGVTTDVTTQVATQVTGVTTALGSVRTDLTALQQRIDAVVGEMRAESAASLRSVGERVDAAVLALAEALLRPRGAEDVPAAAPAPAPAVSGGTTPPWAGAAQAVGGDDSPAAEDGYAAAEIPTLVPDDDEAEDAPWSDAAAADLVGDTETGYEDGAAGDGATADAADAASAADDEDDDTDGPSGDVPRLADDPADEADTAAAPVADETRADEDEDEDEPEPAAPAHAEEPVAGEPAAETAPDEAEADDTADDTTGDTTGDTADDTAGAEDQTADEPAPEPPAEQSADARAANPGEVPVAWPGEPEEDEGGDQGAAAENAFESASGPAAPATPSSWGWDAARDEVPAPAEEEQREKRRPWWRPGG